MHVYTSFVRYALVFTRVYGQGAHTEADGSSDLGAILRSDRMHPGDQRHASSRAARARVRGHSRAQVNTDKFSKPPYKGIPCCGDLVCRDM